MTSLALTVLAPCCKKLAILFCFFLFYCLFQSEVHTQLVGSSASKAVALTIFKALNLSAAPAMGTMTNYIKVDPSLKDL
jgi:hypothetical protein